MMQVRSLLKAVLARSAALEPLVLQPAAPVWHVLVEPFHRHRGLQHVARIVDDVM